MRKALFVLVLITVALLSGACKSKPAPVSQVSQVSQVTEAPRATETPSVPVVTTVTPAATTPGTTTTTTAVPDNTTGNTYGTASNSTDSASSISNRHPSGIILDGAANYIVRRGDTLSGIARQFYKDGSLYPLIMMVSGVVTDPDKILPAMRLTVPALVVNMNDATARDAINRYFLQIAQIEERRGRHGTAAMIRNHTK